MRDNPFLLTQDLAFTIKSHVCELFELRYARRHSLEKLLAIRSRRFAPDHQSFVSVYQGLASTYLAGSTEELQNAEHFAKEAERILLLAAPGRYSTLRHARICGLQAAIQQKLCRPEAALELAEQSLALFRVNHNLNFGCSAVMHRLIDLHKQVGSSQRAAQLKEEVDVLDRVLISSMSRPRF